MTLGRLAAYVVFFAIMAGVALTLHATLAPWLRWFFLDYLDEETAAVCGVLMAMVGFSATAYFIGYDRGRSGR